MTLLTEKSYVERLNIMDYQNRPWRDPELFKYGYRHAGCTTHVQGSGVGFENCEVWVTAGGIFSC